MLEPPFTHKYIDGDKVLKEGRSASALCTSISTW